MSPARTAILGNVLVPDVGQIGLSVDVGPFKGLRDISHRGQAAPHVRNRCHCCLLSASIAGIHILETGLLGRGEGNSCHEGKND